MWFNILLFIVFILFIWTAVLCFKMNENKVGFWEKFPRNRTLGGILSLIALLAFIPNVKPLFSPQENLYWLIPAALILSLLCYLYLDHLFARAMAGALILLSHYLLTESFAADLMGNSFFALMCFLWGTWAIFIAAKPYWLRDFFRLLCRQKKWRLICGTCALLWSLSALILLVQNGMKGQA